MLVRGTRRDRSASRRPVRAVGRANGDNRLSIIVPCHRVIGADGALTGYGGGLARKQKLLDLEQGAAHENPDADCDRSLMLTGRSQRCGAGSFVFMRVAVPALGPVPLAFARTAMRGHCALLALAVVQRRMPGLRTRWRELRGRGHSSTRRCRSCLFCLCRTIRLPRRPPRSLSATSPFFGAHGRGRSGSASR